MFDAIDILEKELVVQDLTTIIDTGALRSLAPLLHPSAIIEGIIGDTVSGPKAIVREMKHFVEFFHASFHTTAASMSTDFVVIEMTIEMTLPRAARRSHRSVAILELRDGFIYRWTQSYVR